MFFACIKKCPHTWSKTSYIATSRRFLLTDNSWAKFAANNAVDLLSLILSADPNKRSISSFSYNFRTQGLDQGIPFGSFGVSRENHEQHVRKPDELQSLQEYEQRQELVSKGARMEALDTATDEILKAAKKLEREVRRETKYWQEIVSIADKGWPIQRVRQNARNVPFAVRYGLPEGGSLRKYDPLSSKELTIMQLVITSKHVDSLLCA
jgi:mediator of RNA polymerase II transcription subunit 17